MIYHREKKPTTPNFPLGPNDKDDVIKINARDRTAIRLLRQDYRVRHTFIADNKKKKCISKKEISKNTLFFLLRARTLRIACR